LGFIVVYCPDCGIEIKEKYKFCPKCGFDLENILPFINSVSRRPIDKAYNVKAVRKTYPMAYKKWTESEEKELANAFRQGLTITELAEKHQRQKGAIRSRLNRLGLITLKP
jgi:zinc-ribbon domain